MTQFVGRAEKQVRQILEEIYPNNLIITQFPIKKLIPYSLYVTLNEEIQKHNFDMDEIKKQTVIDQSRSKNLGRGEIRGELNQILGSYSLLNQYDNIAFLTSVSKQFPLDLIGLKEDSIDFIEIKSLKTPLTSEKSKLVKQLVEEKNVRYKIMEGNLPKNFKIEERDNKNKES